MSLDVIRINGSTGVVSVNFATRDITGLQGSDFEFQSGTLTFGDGVTKQTIVIKLKNDSIKEALEQFRIELSQPLGGATLDNATRQAYVTINDDD